MRLWTRKILPAILPVLMFLPTGCSKNSSSNIGATVTITPSPAFVSLNSTQQFSATVVGIPTISIASNGAVRASNVVTITTTAAHNLNVGQPVTIAGVTDASFTGTFTVSAVPSSTTFTYTESGVDATSGGGTVTNDNVTWTVTSLTANNSNLGSITTGGLYTAPSNLPAPDTFTVTSTGAVRSNGTVTITTAAAHNLVVGEVVLISGVTDTTFDGSVQIATVPSTTTFTFSQTANNSNSGNGTVTAFAVNVVATSVASSSTTATAVVSLQSGVTMTITPPNATVGTNETFQFTAVITGTANNSATWSANNVPGGNSTVGTVSSTGFYTAPAVPPSQSTLPIANSNGAVRSSNVVTITTTSPHGFSVSQNVVIAGVSDTSFNGTFAITSVPSPSTFTFAETGPDASSGGGTAASASNVVTLTAVSVLDPSKSATASVTVVTAADPTLTAVTPSLVAQGALFQDVFLQGTNFISTTVVKVTGVPNCPTEIFQSGIQSSTRRLRLRLLANCLSAPATLSIDVERQNGTATPPQPVSVVTVRPALVGASPDIGVQLGSAFTFNLDGGFFGPNDSSVQGEFNGSGPRALSPTVNDTRQAGITIGSSDLLTAGLFEVGIRNSTNTSLFAAANLAIRPAANPSVLSGPIPVGNQPSAIAINQSTGVAVVTNQCSNSISLIDVNALTTIGAGIAVGAFPTDVAVDDIRNLAVVVNNGNSAGCQGAAGMPSLSIVDLTAGSVTSTLTTNLAAAPLSVGVNPLTGLALVAYQNLNHADIVDLTQSPPAIVSTVSISTGSNPRIAVDSRLNWAVVTPGGTGSTAIVDLSRRVTASIVGSTGVSRANGITTVTTTASHTFIQNEVVLISGVTDPSFNGTFTVNSVPSATTFTYVQSGAPNANSGGGTVVTTPPVAVVSLGSDVRGVTINPFTNRALLVDPTSTTVTFFDLFDQVVTNLSLNEVGAVAAAFSPYTDIAVTLNPSTQLASVIDPRVPSRLTTIPVGKGPSAVAIDPGTNRAFVVNTTDDTVTPIDLGAIRPLHLSMVSLPLGSQFAPAMTLSSATDLPITLVGKGFVSGSVVRLNGVKLPAPSSITDRKLTATVPAAFLAVPAIYVLDVLNPDGTQSNVLNLSVVFPVNLVGAGGAACIAPAPQGVAIDSQRNLAVVTNSGCNSASIIDLNPATIGNIIATVTVDSVPLGVAISPSTGLAVVANSGASDVSLINLTSSPPAVTSTVNVGAAPRGVTVDETQARAFIANSGAASVSVLDLASATVTDTISVDTFPEAVAVDPVDDFLAVASGNGNALDLVDLSTLTITNRVSAPLPTAVVFDPVLEIFIVNSSLGNNLIGVKPTTGQPSNIRSGINPTSIAYNFASSTLVTVNTASATFSVMDMVDQSIRDVLEIPGSPQFSVDIHPRTNLAVVADQNNNRLLLVPLPK